MKTQLDNQNSFTALLGFLILISFLLLTSTANAQDVVRLEGMAHFRVQQNLHRNVLTATGNIERVANYSYQYRTNPLSVVYVLTPHYYYGGVLNGRMVARRNLPGLNPRTYYGNVTLRGRSRAPRAGNYFVVAALVDTYTNGIFDAHTFSRRVRVRRPFAYRHPYHNPYYRSNSDNMQPTATTVTQRTVRVRNLDSSARLGAISR